MRAVRLGYWLGLADRAHGLPRGAEHFENSADLRTAMFGAHRATQQEGARGGCRRARHIDVETAVQQRLPHRDPLFLLFEKNRDDSRTEEPRVGQSCGRKDGFRWSTVLYIKT